MIRRALVWTAVLGTGCATGATLRVQSEDLERRVAMAPEDAYRCAPAQLARADAEVVFMKDALRRADAVAAETHRASALQALADMGAELKACAPKDTDGDGFIDPNDRCVLVPGRLLGCPDADGDGIADLDDRCPRVPEDRDGQDDEDGCPDDQDTDGDGLLDSQDRCVQAVGPIDNQGCPYGDADGDGLVVPRDRCPDEPEDFDDYKDGDGCPDPDNDGDGIADADDLCPNEPETVNGQDDQDGCPDRKLELVKVDTQKGKIEIKQKVFFQLGKARIQQRSFELLNEVAEALQQNPKLKVLVEGHTDAQGSSASNMRLSQQRADAVRRYLIRRGVQPDRLTAIGFGEEKPIDTNATRAGRERNRRVEFTIVGRE